ncbi:MAG: formate--tetrahydrofolate ligase, partial [Alphaproteobacteria bacterium]
MSQPSDIEIARAAKAEPIQAIADKIGAPADVVLPYGRDKAKIDLDWATDAARTPKGKLILVTAMTPTPAGEGKTTTTVGLGDGLRRIGKDAMICLREPSLGPCFGQKGGAAGGGYAQVIPMEAINLHFTGDMHAISTAHNLLAAMVDNHIYWGNGLDLDARRIAWRRVVDMNDRALRQIVANLGGVANGFPRESGYDITVASEVMAILCLATDLADLEARFARIVVGETRERKAVTAADLKAVGAMTVLMKDALAPNLAQTLEGVPAFVHGGPFANIAHGCNSVVATRAALGLADYVVTEAGFGADLGAEKFFDIKCRSAGLLPDAAVVVATARALKFHGGVERADLNVENVAAVEAGLANLGRHLDNVAKYGVPAVVAVNRFTADTEAELEAIRRFCLARRQPVAICTHWADGGAGTEALARLAVEAADSGKAAFKPIYPDAMPLWEKIETVAREVYRADGGDFSSAAATRLAALEDAGYGALPVCMAKTQYSFSADPTRKGAPEGYEIPVREIRLSAGAGFVV